MELDFISGSAHDRALVAFGAGSGVEEGTEPGLGAELVLELGSTAFELLALFAGQAGERIAQPGCWLLAGGQEQPGQKRYPQGCASGRSRIERIRQLTIASTKATMNSTRRMAALASGASR